MRNNKLQELFEEFRTVFSGRAATIDAVIAPLIFVIVNALWGLTAAMWTALAIAVVLTGLRVVRRQPWLYALLGMLGVALAIGLSLLTRQAENFFLPALLTGGGTLLACLITLIIRRPLAALSSHLTRSWPMEWYAHPRVRPAYSEVTGMWAVFFALRLTLQTSLYLNQDAGTLAWANALLGWPVTIAVLVISYLYGTWRLQKLGGPSVEEFQQGSPPPWQGQTRGF